MTTGKRRISQATLALSSVFCIALMLLCCPQPAAAQSIGKATAVKNQVQGIQGGATRSLASGGSVFSNDTVKSGADSVAQLLFLDQTTFTVGANSQAVLSGVYHRSTGVVSKVMKAVAGAFRYVSGVGSPSSSRIEFPQGYITVRGTIVDILAGPDHSVIIVDEGAITVHAYASGTNYDVNAGQMLIVHFNGQTDGPMTIDTTMLQINASIPFPLFGSTIWPTQPGSQGLQTFEETKDRNDILYNLRSSSGSSTGTGCPPNTTPVSIRGSTFCSPNGAGGG
jgi:hypothetical protein